MNFLESLVGFRTFLLTWNRNIRQYVTDLSQIVFGLMPTSCMLALQLLALVIPVLAVVLIICGATARFAMPLFIPENDTVVLMHWMKDRWVSDPNRNDGDVGGKHRRMYVLVHNWCGRVLSCLRGPDVTY